MNRSSQNPAGASSIPAEDSGPLVDLSPMPERDEEEFVPARIELVNHPVVAYPEPIGVRAFHAEVREAAQPSSKFIDLLLHTPLVLQRESQEPVIELARVYLRRCAGTGRAHGWRTRTRPAAISALPAAISSLKASVISRRSSRRFSSQSRNSSCSRGGSRRTAASTCARSLIARTLPRGNT